MLYLALGCFISHPPCALLAKALSRGVVSGRDIPEPSATSPDDQRRTAVLIQQAVRTRPAEQFP